MARCSCATASNQCTCVVQGGDNATVTGNGSNANPYVVNAIVACDDVRPCINAGPGATYDPATGTVGVCVSSQAGNQIVRDASGCLLVPGGEATVTTACGMSGTGSSASPLAVRSATWPFACDVATQGTGIYCAPDGSLRSDPQVRMGFFGQTFNQSFATPVAVPAAATNIATFSVTVTNPDPCREAFVILARQADVDLNLPVGAGAMTGVAGDQMTYDFNSGSTAQNLIHHQGSKVGAGTIGPGATQVFTCDVLAGRGTGGATYERIQADIHVWVISNPG